MTECPESQRLWRFVAGELDKDAATHVADHIVDCSACRESVGLALDLYEPAPVASPSRLPWLLPAVVIAAGVVLVVVASPTPPDPGIEDGPAHQRGDATPALRPTSASALPRDAFVVMWSPGPEGSRYDVSVLTEGLEVIASGHGLETERFEVAADLLEPNTVILWQVTRRDRDGSVVIHPTWKTRVMGAR